MEEIGAEETSWTLLNNVRENLQMMPEQDF
jgi:hypothetical protein